MRLFTLCYYLKTKESYDRWVTRRVWGFRHQISKTKYLKKSVGNIRKLQENTAVLCKMETWSSVLSEFAFLLWAEMDPANRECLKSQAVLGI